MKSGFRAGGFELDTAVDVRSVCILVDRRDIEARPRGSIWVGCIGTQLVVEPTTGRIDDRLSIGLTRLTGRRP